MNKQLTEFNFFDPAVIENPFEFYQVALKESPVYELPASPIPGAKVFLVSGYDHVADALKKPEIFSNRFGALLEGRAAHDEELKAIVAKGWPQVETLLTNDPPSHTRFRKLVNMAFSMKRVNAMGDYMTSIATDLIDKFVDKGECDFMAEFSVPLPVAVIAEQLGADRSETPKFKEWSDAFTDRLGGMASREREIECAELVVEFQTYMHAKLEDRRTNPKDDLLTELVQATLENGDKLNDAELLSVVQQLMVAGNETTTNTLAGGMLLLIQNPDQQAKARENRKIVPNMVEEILRLESATSGMWRVVLEDSELGGVSIPKGSWLHLRYAAANRDPSKFDDPDSFHVDRKNANKQMAFGQGIHVCVGQMLSRKEMNIAYNLLFDRLDNLQLAVGKNDFTHIANIMLRGLKELHITFDKRA